MLSHIELDIEERANAAVPIEALADLTARLLHDEIELPYSPALCLAKDIKRQYGNAGFVYWFRLMRKFEPPYRKIDCQWLQDRRFDWEDLDTELKGWCDYTIVDALATARAAGIGHPSAEAILDDLARRSGAKRAAIQAEHDEIAAAERAAIDAEIEAEYAVYEAWLTAGEPANDPLADDHRTRKRRIRQARIEAEYRTLEKWLDEQYAANEIGDDIPADDPRFAAYVKRSDEIAVENRAKIADWEARHGGLPAIRQLFMADRRIPPGTSVHAMEKLAVLFSLPDSIVVKFAEGGGEGCGTAFPVPPEYHDAMRWLTKPLQWADGRSLSFDRFDPWRDAYERERDAPKFTIPAEILDLHKRQGEHMEATLLGPLPDHPELPINQAETLANFYAHLPSGKIIHIPTRALWTSASADKHLGPIKDAMNPNGRGKLASTFLSQFRCVQSMGWDPAEPVIIKDRVLTQEGWINSEGSQSFNLYIPPDIKHVAGDVSLWLNHIRQLFPNEAEHVVKWLAHRVQRPGDKVNHALVFIGTEGIGKDTILEPVLTAIGRVNFASVSAKHFFESDFNGYLKSVMLRIDEVHDLGGESKYAFHDRTKPVIAAPPSAHLINEKFTPHYVARNVCGVVLTSNHLDALYLSPNDRRHFVCVSDARKEQFALDYFETLHAWFDAGGNEAVAHYLANLDISEFNAKAPPPQTAGWRTLVNAGLAPEAGDMADVIEALGKPDAITLSMIRGKAMGEHSLRAMFDDPKQRTKIPRRLADCGYTVVINPDTTDGRGRWRTNKGKITIYGRQELSDNERLTAARALSVSDLMPSPSIVGPPPPY